jgi:hypothetical protein
MSVALVVDIIGDASKLNSEFDKSTGKAQGFGGALGGSALQIAAVAGVAAVAAGAIASMTQAAADDAAEQARLEAAVTAAGAATATSTSQIEAAIAAGQERAFTDTQTREALMSLVTATGDVTAATGLLTSAQDIARFANVDLATAADAVAKAQAGQDGPLRKLLPGLTAGADATATLAEATKRAAGQADIYATSAQGMQERAGDAFGELGEEIGGAFLPILEALLPPLIEIIKAFGTLVRAVLPLLTPILKLIGQALAMVANQIAGVVKMIADLVQWVGNAIGALGRFLDSINPLKSISLPSLPFLSSAPAAAGGGLARGAPRAGELPAGRAPVINVYTTGDGIEAEQAVVRALRRATRLNGGVIPALGQAWAG